MLYKVDPYKMPKSIDYMGTAITLTGMVYGAYWKAGLPGWVVGVLGASVKEVVRWMGAYEIEGLCMQGLVNFYYKALIQEVYDGSLNDSLERRVDKCIDVLNTYAANNSALQATLKEKVLLPLSDQGFKAKFCELLKKDYKDSIESFLECLNIGGLLEAYKLRLSNTRGVRLKAIGLPAVLPELLEKFMASKIEKAQKEVSKLEGFDGVTRLAKIKDFIIERELRRGFTYSASNPCKDLASSHLFLILGTVSLNAASAYYNMPDTPKHMGVLAIGVANFGSGVMSRYMNYCQYEDKGGHTQNQFLNIVNDSFFRACTSTAMRLPILGAMDYFWDAGCAKSIRLAGGVAVLACWKLESILNSTLQSIGLTSSPAIQI